MRVPPEEWPADWAATPLATICEIEIGKTPDRDQPKYWGGSHTWITIADMTNRVISTSKEGITEKAIDDRQVRLVRAGTLLMSFKLTIGKLAFAGTDLYTNEAIAALSIKDEFCESVVPSFLYWALQSVPIAEEADLAVKGLTLNKKKLARILVPIPYPDDPARSLETQRRIVARIEALFAELRECRKLHDEIVADTGRVMEAAVREVFDQPTDDWQACELGSIAFIQTGTAKGRDFRDRKTVELPYLRVANVQAGYLDLSEVKTIRIAESEISRYCLHPGDLLLTEGGDFDKLGRGAAWSGEIEPCIHQNHIFAVRFDQDVMQPEFAEYEMQSWYAKRYFLGVAKKTTNLATINRTQLAAFPIKFPDLNEQRRIVTYLDSVKREAAELQRIQGQDGGLLAKMEQSILAQAFRGEL